MHVESFGGYYFYPPDLAKRRALKKGKGVIIMRLGKPEQDRVIVTVKSTFLGTEGKQKGKLCYETYKSIDVYDATPQQIEKIVSDALAAKAEK